MPDETRRATCSYALHGTGPTPLAEGQGEAEVTDTGVAAGPVAVEHLDVEALVDSERTLTLTLWPEGRLEIGRLGRRHETFARALSGARDAARAAGLLAHGISAPAEFAGQAAGPDTPAAPARLLVYATHLTVVPAGGDPTQLPYGAITRIAFDEPGHEVRVESESGTHAFGKLGRQTQPFLTHLEAERDAQARRLAGAAGTPGFADGTGVAAGALREFPRLLEAFTAPERLEGARYLLGLAEAGSARLGLVELLDPDGEGLAARTPLPENLAAFLLAPVRGLVVLEVLSGPSAATYVFRGGIDAVNRDLRALHFRRRPLSLTSVEAAGEAGRPYRLALRKLAPLLRLRAASHARVVHSEGWRTRLEAVLSAT